MQDLTAIQGLLFDLDGVLYVDDDAIPGAVETVASLRERGLKLRFCTNTTLRPRQAIAAKLTGLGFAIAAEEILTAPLAAAEHLRREGFGRCHLVLHEAVKADFAELEAAPGEAVDAVVLGDIGDGWNHALLQRIFDEVMAGAALVALHRGRFWQLDGGLALDIGVYVAGLEYVTGRQATVCGKPAPAFFQAGLDALELPAAQVAMVGDDIVSDIGGAQACGLTGVLVRTGKFREEQLTRAGVTPDLVVADVTALA